MTVITTHYVAEGFERENNRWSGCAASAALVSAAIAAWGVFAAIGYGIYLFAQ